MAVSAKAEILRRIERALDGVPPPAPVPRPTIADADAEIADPVALFVDRVRDYRAMVDRTSADGLPVAVARALQGASRVVVPAGLPLAYLTSLAGTEVVTDEGSLTPAELERFDAVLTACRVAVAETGTIVLDHAPDQGPRALTLLPDRHVCIVAVDQLAADVPAAVARLRESVEAGRALTWISGPSATSDIELDRVEGVHGPRDLRILVVE
jgi:L-lactate dehydrogenase complex protein LldG